MTMMEEFRRRKNLQRYYDMMKKQKQTEELEAGRRPTMVDMED
jgi:ribosomal protein S5